MQKLTLPFKKSMMICGFKVQPYLAQWGYPHYGIDISTIQGGANPSNPNIYASGDGKVVFAGYDNSGGNVIGIIYDEVYNHHTGEIYDLVARYMHLDTIDVTVGQIVNRNTIIGVEGKTKTNTEHLHLEFDKDTKYYRYSFQVANSDDYKTMAQGNILLKGSGPDTSVNPNYVLYIGSDQELVDTIYNHAWYNEEDFNVPRLEETTNTDEIDALKEEIEDLKDKMKLAEETLVEHIDELNKLGKENSQLKTVMLSVYNLIKPYL